jgi:O-phosphoseryl-tRNA(Cys) synthetase
MCDHSEEVVAVAVVVAVVVAPELEEVRPWSNAMALVLHVTFCWFVYHTLHSYKVSKIWKLTQLLFSSRRLSILDLNMF